MKRLFLSFIFLSLCACGTKTNVLYDFNGPALIEYPTKVQVSTLELSITPTVAPKKEAKVVMMPIRMMQSMENSIEVSKSISWQIWKVWAQTKVFSNINYVSSLDTHSLQSALQYARAQKASILITGMSNFFLDGGSVGTSRVSISLQIYDVATGSVLWSIHQDGELKPSDRMDYMVFSLQKTMPNDSIGMIVATLAYNMVQPVKLWQTSGPHFTTESFNTQTAL